jgi:hypothetical protein
MKLLVIALTLLATTSYLLAGSKPALACTPDDRYNPVRESKVIVAGRITGWEHTSGLYKEIGVPPIPSAVKVNVRVTVAVDQVLKGSTSSPLVYTDRGLFIAYDGVRKWGISSDCAGGAFQADAFEGKYTIVGLNDDRGPLRPEAFFFLGDEPSGSEYERALDRIEELGKNRFPYVPVKLFYMLAVGAVVVVIVAGAHIFRRRLLIAAPND